MESGNQAESRYYRFRRPGLVANKRAYDLNSRGLRLAVSNYTEPATATFR